MKKLRFPVLAALFAMLMPQTAVAQEPQFKGHLDGLETDTLWVIRMDMVNDQTTTTDTIIAHNGDFEFSLPQDKVYPVGIVCVPKPGNPYGLMAAVYGAIRFMSLPGESATITGQKSEPQIHGTQTYEEINGIKASIVPNQQEIQRLAGVLGQVERGEDSVFLAKGDSVRRLMNAEQRKIADIIKAYAKAHPDSKAPACMLDYFMESIRLDGIAALSPQVAEGSMATYVQPLKKALLNKQQREVNARQIAEGKAAPDFTLTDIDGATQKSLSDFRGKYVLLDFWGSWCVYCIKGMPKMKDYYAKYKDKLEILGIDCNDKEQAWKDAVAKHELPWVHLRNNGTPGKDVSVLYGVNGYPTKVLIDPQGTIVYQMAGEDDSFYVRLDEILGK